MNPLERAESVISRARALHRDAVCPGDAGSPMDLDMTITVPRGVITSCESHANNGSLDEDGSLQKDGGLEQRVGTQ